MACLSVLADPNFLYITWTAHRLSSPQYSGFDSWGVWLHSNYDEYDDTKGWALFATGSAYCAKVNCESLNSSII